jgi:hypothetical protein
MKMMFWQHSALPHSEQRARKRTQKHDNTDNTCIHDAASDFPSPSNDPENRARASEFPINKRPNHRFDPADYSSLVVCVTARE